MAKISITLDDGITYEKSGWFGCQLKSLDNTANLGDVRLIDGKHLMYVWSIDKRIFRKNIVHWSLVSLLEYSSNDNKSKTIRRFYKDLGL
jgi:hypothetical protein